MTRARRGPDRGSTPATQALDAAGIHYQPRAYEHDPGTRSYGAEAASALGVDPARVLKTLITDDGSDLAAAVVPVDARLDLKALARALGVKRLRMADPAAAERSTGYVVGGISPIGQRRPLRTVLDSSARRFETVLVSGGRRGLDIELAPEDLARAARAVWADIASGR